MAPSKILVELLIDMAHLGRKGNIIEVTSVQARNFLIPKKIARAVTPEQLKLIEEKAKRTQDQARMKLEKAYEIQKLLDGQSVSFTLSGKNGKVFGGINEHMIISRIQQKWGITLEKHDIKLPNNSHIKTVGTHLVYLSISKNAVAKIFAEVTLA